MTNLVFLAGPLRDDGTTVREEDLQHQLHAKVKHAKLWM